MIEVCDLVKRYGDKTAVNGLSFTVRPGVVTGFLGPNGAGKSTTIRAIVGLDRPTAGRVTVNGRAYEDWPAPLAQAGVMLEARAVHPGRSAYDHLLALGATHGIGARRVAEVLDLAGLGAVARKRAGSFSLGMGQRLGIAAALLADPQTVILDEPVNGLDPDGVRWVRHLLRDLAGEGRTVLVSSHLMSEMALTAGHLVVIGRGELIADTSVSEFLARSAASSVRVRTPDAARLRDLLSGPEVSVSSEQAGVLMVSGLASDQIGTVAAGHGITLWELAPQQASLEDAFMEVTREAADYRAPGAGRPPAGAGRRS
jgi:ABC-2 type transport system ATP-binding protein